MFWLNHEKRKAKRKQRATRRRVGTAHHDPRHAALEALEARLYLSGNPVVQNQAYTVITPNTLNEPAPGLLTGATDPNNEPLTLSATGSPTDASSFSSNGNGSFAYTPMSNFVGTDSFGFSAYDSGMNMSNQATATIHVEYAVTSAVDQTKLPVDTVSASRQIIGDSSGTPAGEHNMALAYSQMAAHPTTTIEGDFTTSLANGAMLNETVTATLTFNGVQQPLAYYSLGGMNGGSSTIHVAMPFDASSLATGRYAYSLSIDSPNMSAPATIDGALNVVNDAAGPAGAGWDIPGVQRLYVNSASGVAAGVLETDGTGNAFYYTQGSGNAYTSPAGDFSTLTSVSGGGWTLVDKYGATYNFNAAGFKTSEVARTGLTNTYNYSGGLLTSITDTFGRSVDLGYTSGLLSSITDLAGNVTTVGHTGTDLTSITLPNPGGGAPEWQYAYSTGHYLTGVTDPMANATSYTLGAGNLISQTTLPGGASSTASGEQGMGFGGATSTNPPNAMMGAAVQPSTTDMLGNTSTYQTDALGNPLSFTDANGQTTTWARDANGLVTTLTQPAPATGQQQPVTTFTYDTLGNQTSAVGALDSFGVTTFNSFSEPTQRVNTLNDVWTWVYDVHGNLLSTTDPLLNTVTYTVDSYGNPLTMTQPAPNNAVGTITTSYAYDSFERLIKITFPDNSTETFTYTTNDQLAGVTDQNGHTMSYTYNVDGLETSMTNAANGVMSYTYNADGMLLTTTDEMGNVTTDAWNSRGELTSVTLPVPAAGVSAPVWTYTYNSDAQKLTQVDPMGNTTSWGYDALQRVTSITLPNPGGSGGTSPVITIGYDNLSRQISETNPLGGVTTTAYDSHNWVTSVTAPNAGGGAPVTQYGYDAIEERTSTTDPMGHVNTTAYTADGQVASVTDNLGNMVAYAYGHDGELLTTTDALSHVTSNTYNNRLWLVSTTDANSGTTQYGYDPAGNRTSLTDSVGNTDSWTYSPTNLVLTDTNQLGYTITYVRDAMGDVIQETDRNGLVRDFTYDNLMRETAELWMSGNTVVRTIAFAYTADNAVTSASDPSSSYAFTYDNLMRVTSVDNSGTPNIPHVVLASEYDAMNNRTQLTATVAGVADFLNSYTYDALRQLTQETQMGQTGGNGVAPKGIGYSYNLDSQFTQVLRFDPTTASPHPDIALGSYSYDAGNRLTSLDYTHLGNAIDGYTLAYDAANRVTSMTSSVDGTATYSYDTTNQVTAASYTGTNQPANEVYSFDKNGNRTNTGYTTGANNQLTSDGTFNYTYDHQGNRLTRTRISSAQANDYQTTYAWDYRNRLTDVQYYNNSGVLTKHVHYVYDVYDHLIGTELDPNGGGAYTSSEWYVLDLAANPNAPALPVLQFDGGGNETYRFLNGPTAGGVDAVMGVMGEEAITTQGSAGTTTYALADNLGSVRDIVNASSVVVDHIVYNSFGNVVYESGTVAHWAGYAGYHTDANTGLDYADHRWYDPSVGRWISEDPRGFGGGDTNVSRYVGNGTTNAVDPTGLQGQATSQPTGFWNSVGNSIWSMGQTYVGIYQQATGNPQYIATYNNAYQAGPLGQTQNSSGVYYYGTRGAIAVSCAAMAGATMAWSWAAAGGATWGVGWTPGTYWYGHVVFGASPWGGGAMLWYSYVGPAGWMVIHAFTPTAATYTLTGFPILVPAAVATGGYAYNCATGAASSLYRCCGCCP